MVSAWAEANELVLGQRKVNEKSNEITAIPELLKALDVSGCIITIDAIGTKTKIAKAIIDGGADYLLSVKENQGYLYDDISWLFEYDQRNKFKDASYDHAKTVNKGHGRIEIRECWTISDPEYLQSLKGASRWKKLRSIAWSLQPVSLTKRPLQKTGITSPAFRARLNNFCTWRAGIGVLKMNFTES